MESDMSADRDPIKSPGTSKEHKDNQVKGGRVAIMLIAGVGILAFGLYGCIMIWAAQGS
jgi:hypothetical protein